MSKSAMHAKMAKLRAMRGKGRKSMHTMDMSSPGMGMMMDGGRRRRKRMSKKAKKAMMEMEAMEKGGRRRRTGRTRRIMTNY